jgi:hypothetical protein
MTCATDGEHQQSGPRGHCERREAQAANAGGVHEPEVCTGRAGSATNESGAVEERGRPDCAARTQPRRPGCIDDLEAFYNQRRRHPTIGQISPAAFERQANQAA